MITKLLNASDMADYTPELATETSIPKMGDTTVSLINKALAFVQHDPRLFRFEMDIYRFEMDVMVVNQYHSVSPSILETNELLPESCCEKGSKAYLRAYNSAQQVLNKYQQLSSKSTRKYPKHRLI